MLRACWQVQDHAQTFADSLPGWQRDGQEAQQRLMAGTAELCAAVASLSAVPLLQPCVRWGFPTCPVRQHLTPLEANRLCAQSSLVYTPAAASGCPGHTGVTCVTHAVSGSAAADSTYLMVAGAALRCA